MIKARQDKLAVGVSVIQEGKVKERGRQDDRGSEAGKGGEGVRGTSNGEREEGKQVKKCEGVRTR